MAYVSLPLPASSTGVLWTLNLGEGCFIGFFTYVRIGFYFNIRHPNTIGSVFGIQQLNPKHPSLTQNTPAFYGTANQMAGANPGGPAPK